jgi:dipeptidyl aminopeptidase/acylaminoacyl peptidase
VIGIPDENDLAGYRWAGNSRVLYSIGASVDWFGVEARATRLSVYDMQTGTHKFLGKRDEGLEGDDILYVDADGQWLLLSVQRTIFDFPSVQRIDLATGKMVEITKQHDNIYQWIADNKGVVRMGLGVFGQSYRILYRRGETEDFKLVAKPKVGDDNAIYDVMRIYQDSDEGYVLSNEKSGRYALYKFNLASREIGEMVFDNPSSDIDDFDTALDGKSLLFASYTDDRQRIHWFDPIFSELQNWIDTGLKGKQNWMTSWSRGKSVVMVWTGDSNDPGRYYLFYPGNGQMNLYYVPNKALKPGQLAKSEYVTYKARDGLDIPAYLTLPKGREAKGLPLIVLPHGGPFGIRDELAYDAEVQFFANRGYAVLQPNFRGSGGYGKAFSDKGYGQWGRLMQDDLDDGMDWLVKRGIVDAGRVCIVGSSYGGYAALWGAIRNPERYRCAASFAGVADLRRQLKYDLNFFIAKKYQRDWRDKIRGAENFDLDSVSPVAQADRLKVPVLIAHGERDTNVPFKQSKALVDALKKAGKTYEFYSYPEEGHGLEKAEDMKDWLDRLEAFLDKYNPA